MMTARAMILYKIPWRLKTFIISIVVVSRHFRYICRLIALRIQISRKNRKLNSLVINIIIAIMITGYGCAPTSGMRPFSFNDLQSASHFSANPENIYPEQFKMIQRCILNAGNRRISFNGYLSVDGKKGEIRCVAQNSLGGTLFKYILNKGGSGNDREKENGKNEWQKINVLHKLPSIKKKWITQGAAKDAAILFLPPKFSQGFHYNIHDDSPPPQSNDESLWKNNLLRRLSYKPAWPEHIFYPATTKTESLWKNNLLRRLSYKPAWPEHIFYPATTNIESPLKNNLLRRLSYKSVQENYLMDDRARLAEYRIIREKKILYEAFFSYDDKFMHNKKSIPHVITIIDHSMHYKLKITLVKFICPQKPVSG